MATEKSTKAVSNFKLAGLNTSTGRARIKSITVGGGTRRAMQAVRENIARNRASGNGSPRAARLGKLSARRKKKEEN